MAMRRPASTPDASARWALAALVVAAAMAFAWLVTSLAGAAFS
ncbi:MAG TPA: hypothetical protein VFV35_04865 [Acidimicrobiales bacterium]|nr:hypothetical protein [Acidimicrobiales bacterium]